MSIAALDSFMQLKSIDPNFITASGEPATVADDNIKNIIKLMGFDADDESALFLHYQEEEVRHWLSLLAPVSVFQQSTTYELEVHLPIDFVTDPLVYRVTTEDGLQIDNLLTATDFPLLAVNEISDVEFQLYSVTLPVELDLGYHHLALLEEGNEEPLALMPLIITPDVCYKGKQLQKDEKVASANLCLPNSASGESNFTTLKTSVTQALKNGCKLLHLHLDPQLQSLSEQWAKLLYIDLTTIAEFKNSQAAQEQVKALPRLTENNTVEVIKFRLTVLRHLFDQMPKENNKRWDEFSTFMSEGGVSLKQQVSFNALHYKFLSEKGAFSECSTWPTPFQSYSSQGTQDWITENAPEILFWYYCDWIIEQQLTALDEFALTQGITLGFYKQLILGAAKNSVQMWAQNESYCKNIMIETPLDRLTELDQSEKCSPLLPDQVYKSGYQPFIELLQLNMKHCGVLHVKNISTLLRLWWVPENAQREQGAFVYYNVYDMLNLLALESIRNQCVVVSDDLEPVPDGMEALLQEAMIYPLSLFEFK